MFNSYFTDLTLTDQVQWQTKIITSRSVANHNKMKVKSRLDLLHMLSLAAPNIVLKHPLNPVRQTITTFKTVMSKEKKIKQQQIIRKCTKQKTECFL